jgi:hypothetical protein
MPPVAEENPSVEEVTREADNAAREEYESKRHDQRAWNTYLYGYGRARWRLAKLFKRSIEGWHLKDRGVIEVDAYLEHFWPDGSVAVSVCDKRIGWLEFDIPEAGLPSGINPRDTFKVLLRLDSKGHVISHQIPPEAQISPATESSIGSRLSARIPPRPSNWDDAEEVARAKKALAEWEKKAGLGRGETGSE